MKKKMAKTIFITLLILMSITVSVAPVFAAGTKGSTFDPGQIDASKGTVSTDKMSNLGNNIAKIVTTAGSIISVIVLVILGIKYMLGSSEEKAEYKKTLLLYIIGAAFVFAASTIASVIFNFASSI